MRKKRILTAAFGIMLLTANFVFGQNAAQFTQFTFNRLNFNPALVGAYEALTVSGFYRHQWFGVQGAPRTGMVNVVAPLTRHNTILGGSISYDNIGMTQTGNASLSYAYQVRFRSGLRLIGGLLGSVEYGRVDWSMANPEDVTDGLLGEGMENKFNPNFGAGLALHARHWYVGFSAPRFMRNHLFRNELPDEVIPGRMREYYLMGGVDIGLGPNLRFRPNTLVSYNPSVPLSMAFDASFLIANRFITGAAYRLDNAGTLFLQYRMSPEWKMGFAYDLTLSKLNTYSHGTAEIMLEYSMDRVKDGVRHIRFF
jgi:type IX secretion system PorP/SprF family membrane protein